MKECVWAIYFSPTGGTKKAALYLAEGLGKEVKEVDLSAPDFNGAEFKKDDLVIVAAPAFGGRIPALMAERLSAPQERALLLLRLPFMETGPMRMLWWS